MSKNIYIAADHGGFNLKEKLKTWLEDQEYGVDNLNYEVFDLGADSLVPDDDYPAYAISVANQVASDTYQEKDSVGILLCRSGGGMVIAANKVKGIRAVSVFDKKSAVHARQDNDANIISISADWTDETQVKEIILTFLNTPFSGEKRHIRRINQIKEFENRGNK